MPIQNLIKQNIEEYTNELLRSFEKLLNHWMKYDVDEKVDISDNVEVVQHVDDNKYKITVNDVIFYLNIISGTKYYYFDTQKIIDMIYTIERFNTVDTKISISNVENLYITIKISQFSISDIYHVFKFNKKDTEKSLKEMYKGIVINKISVKGYKKEIYYIHIKFTNKINNEMLLHIIQTIVKNLPQDYSDGMYKLIEDNNDNNIMVKVPHRSDLKLKSKCVIL